MSKKATKVLTAQETLAKNIVDGIRNKSINFGIAKKYVAANGAKGERFTSKANKKGAIVNVTMAKAKEATNPRYNIEISFPGKVKGTVSKAQITGKYARLAWKALTHVPAVRKPKISEQDLALANEAFGF